jgi:hypothetical protein
MKDTDIKEANESLYEFAFDLAKLWGYDSIVIFGDGAIRAYRPASIPGYEQSVNLIELAKKREEVFDKFREIQKW